MALRAALTKLAAVAGLLCIGAAQAAETSFVPVHRDNFPDPFVVEHNGEFIAYATNAGVNLPMLTSRDLINWTPVIDPAIPGSDKRRDGLPRRLGRLFRAVSVSRRRWPSERQISAWVRSRT